MLRIFGEKSFMVAFPLWLGLLLLGFTATATAEPVSVELTSGRKFSGEVDSRTNDTQLWLRFGNPGAILKRPLDWSSVVAVTIGEKTLTAAEFRDRVKSEALTQNPFDDDPQLARARRATLRANAAAGLNAAPVAPARVTALRLDATVANWDSDVELDGVLVCVLPLDAQGRLTPIDGMLEIDLLGQRRSTTTVGELLPQIGRWTQVVRPADFGPQGAVYRLPFQAFDPQFDLQLTNHGTLHGRLLVAGQGVFEDSQDNLTIRPFSAARNQLQQLHGTRFLDQENTGRGKTLSPLPQLPSFE